MTRISPTHQWTNCCHCWLGAGLILCGASWSWAWRWCCCGRTSRWRASGSGRSVRRSFAPGSRWSWIPSWILVAWRISRRRSCLLLCFRGRLWIHNNKILKWWLKLYSWWLFHKKIFCWIVLYFWHSFLYHNINIEMSKWILQLEFNLKYFDFFSCYEILHFYL